MLRYFKSSISSFGDIKKITGQITEIAISPSLVGLKSSCSISLGQTSLRRARMASNHHHQVPSSASRKPATGHHDSKQTTRAALELLQRLVIPTHLAVPISDGWRKECEVTMQNLKASLNAFESTLVSPKDNVEPALFHVFYGHSNNVKTPMILARTKALADQLLANGISFFDVEEEIDFWYGITDMGMFTYLQPKPTGTSLSFVRPKIDYQQWPKRYSAFTICVTMQGFRTEHDVFERIVNELARFGLLDQSFDDLASSSPIASHMRLPVGGVVQEMAIRRFKQAKSRLPSDVTIGDLRTLPFIRANVTLTMDCWLSTVVVSNLLKSALNDAHGRGRQREFEYHVGLMRREGNVDLLPDALINLWQHEMNGDWRQLEEITIDGQTLVCHQALTSAQIEKLHGLHQRVVRQAADYEATIQRYNQQMQDEYEQQAAQQRAMDEEKARLEEEMKRLAIEKAKEEAAAKQAQETAAYLADFPPLGGGQK